MAIVSQNERAEEQEIAQLELTSWGSLGDTLAAFEDGTINVFGGIPGEQVEVRILRYRRRRQDHVSGIVTRVLTPSPHRVKAPCGYFGACTGCQWQHIAYEHQLELKRDRVSDNFSKYFQLQAVQISPTLPSPQLLNYRNHARFTVRNGGQMGFINRLSRRFVKIDECMIMDPGINESVSALQDKVAETTQLSIRLGVNTGDLLIQPLMVSSEITVKTGQTHYTESLMGHKMRIASPSFAQVNTPQTEQMMKLVRNRLGLTGQELLIDAYAGVGVFAILLAPYAHKVFAIEDSPSAVEDGKRNAEGLDNVEVVLGRSEVVLSEFESHVDAVILDPSRKGCHPDVIAAVGCLAPDHVVLVSCDVGSMARDLASLVAGPFVLEEIQPVDMFPQTRHIENVSFLRYEA